MLELKQSAIEAVARHFSGTSQSDDPSHAYLMVNGRRIALDVAIIAGKPSTIKPARLREDRVAQRVLRDLDAALRGSVPHGRALVLTLGAPIKVSKQLVAALTHTLLTYFARGATEKDEHQSILGNRVRFRVVSDCAKWKANVFGFVFTGDPAPGELAGTLRALHNAIAKEAKIRKPKKFTGERWLVLAAEQWIADIKTYRRAYGLLSPRHDFRRILLVLASGRVEILAEN